MSYRVRYGGVNYGNLYSYTIYTFAAGETVYSSLPTGISKDGRGL